MFCILVLVQFLCVWVQLCEKKSACENKNYGMWLRELIPHLMETKSINKGDEFLIDFKQ
jgi:hypothetical protein